MPYIPHTEKDLSRILERIGAASVEDILKGLPSELKSRDGLKGLPQGLSEQELAREAARLSQKNSTVSEYSSFLGAGAYNHYVPATVSALISRSEFYTAYTPYQPEISQGTLQAIFEYQTLVAQLTGMEVSNASMYDGASATAEAVLMARRITGKKGVVLSSALHPEYRAVIETYLEGMDAALSDVPFGEKSGTTDLEALRGSITDETACLVIQHPNFFGCLEDLEAASEIIHAKKGLLIVVTNEAVSFGLLKPPGESGADIAVGDNQSFGNPLSFGGPYLGYLATKESFLRQMPGRIVGQTVDRAGKRAFCLTFATREQHIRRERATSNICTNHGLCALAASIHMVSLGKGGLIDLARLNLSKAEYLKSLLRSSGVELPFNSPTFNEFTVRLKKDPEAVLKALAERKILGGVAMRRFNQVLENDLLVAVTEMNTREEIETLASEISRLDR